MNDLTKLSNEQLGDFIQISLIHGTNTQFSYELLHEVASRLKHTDGIIKAGISNGIHDTLTKQSTAFKFRLEDVVQTFDDALTPADKDFEEIKEAVKVAEEVIVNPVNENDEDISEELLAEKIAQEQMAARKAKKKEKVTVKESLTVEPTVQEEVQETPAALSITADDLKAKALEMRQKNTVSAADIKSKLTDLGATTILTLDTKHYNEFNAFLDSHNV